MAKIELKLNGVQELQEKLLKMKQALEEQLEDELLKIAEDALTYSKLHKGYKDHTANLKNTISYVLFKDGKPITKYIGQNTPKKGKKAKNIKQVTSDYVQGKVDDYVAQNGIDSTKGYTLVVVAPMDYAKPVESKGYNVLYLTRFYLKDRIKEMIENLILNL